MDFFNSLTSDWDNLNLYDSLKNAGSSAVGDYKDRKEEEKARETYQNIQQNTTTPNVSEIGSFFEKNKLYIIGGAVISVVMLVIVKK